MTTATNDLLLAAAQYVLPALVQGGLMFATAYYIARRTYASARRDAKQEGERELQEARRKLAQAEHQRDLAERQRDALERAISDVAPTPVRVAIDRTLGRGTPPHGTPHGAERRPS